MFSDVWLSRGVLYTCLLTAAFFYFLFFLLLFQSPAEFVSCAELLSLWTHVHDLQILLNRLISLISIYICECCFFSNSFLLIQICALASYQVENYLHASVVFPSCLVLEVWPIPALFQLSGLPATWHHFLIRSFCCFYPVTNLSCHFFFLSHPLCLTSNTHLSIFPVIAVPMSIHSIACTSPWEQSALLSQHWLWDRHTQTTRMINSIMCGTRGRVAVQERHCRHNHKYWYVENVVHQIKLSDQYIIKLRADSSFSCA